MTKHHVHYPNAFYQVGSFLRWAGGTGQPLPQFTFFLPCSPKRRNYVEHFMGSTALERLYDAPEFHNHCTYIDRTTNAESGGGKRIKKSVVTNFKAADAPAIQVLPTLPLEVA